MAGAVFTYLLWHKNSHYVIFFFREGEKKPGKDGNRGKEHLCSNHNNKLSVLCVWWLWLCGVFIMLDAVNVFPTFINFVSFVLFPMAWACLGFEICEEFNR